MKILVDTCIALWAQKFDDRLSKETIAIISNIENEIYFSTMSAWEVEIKHSKHPDNFMINGTEFIENCEGMYFLTEDATIEKYGYDKIIKN